jgi:hypothetical protein
MKNAVFSDVTPCRCGSHKIYTAPHPRRWHFFSIKMDLKGIDRKTWTRFRLAQDMDQWWALENTIINLCGPSLAKNVLTD